MRLNQLRTWARRLKQDALTVYYAARHPGSPWALRVLALAVAAYALSPIDLIPDFIPVLGYLDDLVLVPLGVWLVVRLLPEAVIRESRERAAAAVDRPVARTAAVVIVTLWLLAAAWLAWVGYGWFRA